MLKVCSPASAPSHRWEKRLQMRSGSAVCYLWPSQRIPPHLRFAFRRIGYWDSKGCRWTQIGGLIRAVQSLVCPKPFVVMCHTPARQTASWSGQQQTQLVEPRLRSLCFSPPAPYTAVHHLLHTRRADRPETKQNLYHRNRIHINCVNLTHLNNRYE